MAKSRRFKEAKDLIEGFLQDELDLEISPEEVARHLRRIHKGDADLFIEYMSKMPHDILGDVAMRLPDFILKDVLEKLPSVKLKEAIEELESDDATDFLQNIEEISEEKAGELFEILDKDYQEDIKKLRRYSDEEAGAYMQTEVFTGKIDEKVSDAVKRLRKLKESGELENIHRLFIVDDYETLLFDIPLEDLITSDFNLTFKEIIEQAPEDEYRPILARDDESIDDVIESVENYDLSVIPVVDYHGRLVGRITADDVHDIIQESATEQIYNLAGVSDEAEQDETMFKAGRARAAWNMINLFTAFAAASVIGFFEDTIESFVALAVLMPIVASMGGNAGNQALAVTVRQLALGKISFNNAKETIFKEATITSVNGLIFAGVVGSVAYIWFGEIRLGFIIAGAMIINFFCAGFFGAFIPLTLKRVGFDPAVGSSILLTAITDMMGFFSFLGLASWVLL
ncbi:MAG: magnesium transporter [Campylobacteraceae bacterium]|nr:magnesium transporter [Campylobacteraceae bacterium]